MAARAIGAALLRSTSRIIVLSPRVDSMAAAHGQEALLTPLLPRGHQLTTSDHRNGDEEKFSDILVQGALNAANFWILSGMFYLWWVKPIWEDLKERSDNAAKERLIMKDEITRACQRIQDILEDYQEDA
ncbi:hypothetical protein ACP70R_028537 [Stipagrostis hirtigluma subsp. patula]